ncbi:hypothetical protein HDU76_004632, partial [Blyttiomyces sp. JEL0837]
MAKERTLRKYNNLELDVEGADVYETVDPITIVTSEQTSTPSSSETGPVRTNPNQSSDQHQQQQHHHVRFIPSSEQLKPPISSQIRRRSTDRGFEQDFSGRIYDENIRPRTRERSTTRTRKHKPGISNGDASAFNQTNHEPNTTKQVGSGSGSTSKRNPGLLPDRLEYSMLPGRKPWSDSEGWKERWRRLLEESQELEKELLSATQIDVNGISDSATTASLKPTTTLSDSPLPPPSDEIPPESLLDHVLSVKDELDRLNEMAESLDRNNELRNRRMEEAAKTAVNFGSLTSSVVRWQEVRMGMLTNLEEVVAQPSFDQGKEEAVYWRH